MTTNNMYLWDQVKDPDTTLSDKATKEFSGKGGFKGTATDPMTLYAMATKLWGPIGLAYADANPEVYISGTSTKPRYPCWGFEEVSSEVVAHEHVCKVRFWYPDTQAGVMKYAYGVGCTPVEERIRGELSPTNDFAKKSLTDAQTNAMSRVGFAANVYLGKYNDSKYAEEVKQRQRAAVVGNEPAVQEVRDALASIHADVDCGAVTTEQAIDRMKAVYAGPYKALPQAGRDHLAGGLNALKAKLQERKTEGK